MPLLNIRDRLLFHADTNRRSPSEIADLVVHWRDQETRFLQETGFLNFLIEMLAGDRPDDAGAVRKPQTAGCNSASRRLLFGGLR